eukprot:SAG31_NODE_6237_length_2107_cov_2.461155_2_plen_35_part_00
MQHEGRLAASEHVEIDSENLYRRVGIEISITSGG